MHFLLRAILPYVAELRKVVVVCQFGSELHRDSSLFIEELNNDVFRKQGKLERVSATLESTWFWELEAKKG
jgi:hypothetical protein